MATRRSSGYRKAAANNHAGGMFNLGCLYLDGKAGVTKNGDEAIKWFQQAAANNHAGGMCCVGECYRDGVGVTKNGDEAIKWFQQAAANNDADAMCCLGTCYQYGIGTPQDLSAAIDWYDEGVMRNQQESMVSLGWIYRAGRGRGASLQEAKRLLTDSKYPFALAELLAASYDIEDIQEAQKLLAEVPLEHPYQDRAQWLVESIQDKLHVLGNLQGGIIPKPDFLLDSDIQIVGLMGEGQFGKVYLAWFQKTKWVAVKIFGVDLVNSRRGRCKEHRTRTDGMAACEGPRPTFHGKVSRHCQQP